MSISTATQASADQTPRRQPAASVRPGVFLASAVPGAPGPHPEYRGDPVELVEGMKQWALAYSQDRKRRGIPKEGLTCGD